MHKATMLKHNNKALAAKVIATCLILSMSMQMCCASAIPIWELLTRNEKMSYLYSTFGQLVSVHCKATAATSALPVNQCKRNLLAYGYEKLQTFSIAQLDLLDPYQHGASELIWSSIMRDHPSSTLITTRKPLPTPPDSSIIILTHQKPATSGSIAIAAAPTAAVPNQSQQYPQNPLFDSAAEHKHKFAMDMDTAYGYTGVAARPRGDDFSVGVQQPHHETFLTGPLVFRVRPDGTPVEEDRHKPLPRDDDLEAFQLSSAPSSSSTTTSTSGRPKHRKIATISALKQQHLATLALKQVLQPPYEQSRVRRQQQAISRAIPLTQAVQSTFGGYYYGKQRA